MVHVQEGVFIESHLIVYSFVFGNHIIVEVENFVIMPAGEEWRTDIL